MKEIIYTLSETDIKFQTEIKDMVENRKSQNTKSNYGQLLLGARLVEIKKVKERDFFNVITESIQSKKTTQRDMKRVLKVGVDFTKGMKITGTDKDITENVKLLEFDKRVIKLTENDIGNIYEPTLVKIENMKNLTVSDWDMVVSGENTPYTELLETQKKEKKDKSDKERDSKKPKGMDSTEFLGMVKNGIYPTINTVYDFTVENTKLERIIKDLERKIKSLEKTNQKSSEKNSELSGMIKGMNTVSGNLQNFGMKQKEKI